MPRVDQFETYYSILGVSSSASTKEISRAYRKASLRVHPDRGGSSEEFRRLGLAYDVLRDPELRKRYDKYGPSLNPSPGNLIGSGTVGRLMPLALSAAGAAAFQFSWAVGACGMSVWGLGCALSAGGSWLKSRQSSGRTDSVAPAILGGLLLGTAAGQVVGFGARGMMSMMKRRH